MDELEFESPQALADLQQFVARLVRLDARGAVRIQTRQAGAQTICAVTGCVLAPQQLTERTPTILGQRVFRIGSSPDAAASPETAVQLDQIFELRSITERLARLTAESTSITLPPAQTSAVWAGIAPPMSGWEAVGHIAPESLAAVAREGAAEIAAGLPTSSGELLVQKLRSAVWSRPIVADLPAGAAFALDSLGFIGADAVRFYQAGSWRRLQNAQGTVLARLPI